MALRGLIAEKNKNIMNSFICFKITEKMNSLIEYNQQKHVKFNTKVKYATSVPSAVNADRYVCYTIGYLPSIKAKQVE